MTVTIKDFAREAVKTRVPFPSVLIDGLEKRKVSYPSGRDSEMRSG